MDILEFYGLKEDPFRLTPDPVYFFPSASHSEALLSLNYVVQQKEGFCLVTGEPGTGKTTVINVFKESWRDKAETALVLTPRLSPEEFLLSVLEDLNVKLTTTNKNDILKAFRDFLVEKSQIGKPVIIIVDEAQNLPDETLEELRLLSNLETYKDKLLQIILIAQPELEKRLNKDKLRQLSQRITVRARLTPLQSDETLEYINYRLIKAGKGFLRLDGGLSKPIYKFSAGIPRIINILASRAIMSAYLEGSNIVTKKHVRYAIRHLKGGVMGVEIKRRSKLVYALSVIILSIITGAAGYYYLVEQKGIPNLPKVESPVQVPHDTKDTTQAIKSATEGPSPAETEQKGTIEKQEQRKTATVISNSANLRSGPSLNSERVAWTQKGAILEIIDEFKEATGKRWYKVKVPDGREGWIADKVVSKD
ncbi:MAG: AAA family ATPase [Thermodesulfovibrionales bacterium]|nr:AAA family ATPase [Thermodesulfovibrionales bacterium]